MNKVAFEYIFIGIDGLRCDSEGNFFYQNNPIKKQWRPGQIFLLINGRRQSIRKLRTLTRKVKQIEIPF